MPRIAAARKRLAVRAFAARTGCMRAALTAGAACIVRSMRAASAAISGRRAGIGRA
jgi:hypothetical protein